MSGRVVVKMGGGDVDGRETDVPGLVIVKHQWGKSSSACYWLIVHSPSGLEVVPTVLPRMQTLRRAREVVAQLSGFDWIAFDPWDRSTLDAAKRALRDAFYPRPS